MEMAVIQNGATQGGDEEEDGDDYYGYDEDEDAAPEGSTPSTTTTLAENTPEAQLLMNTASIRGLEKSFFDFRKRIRQRVKNSRKSCNDAKRKATKNVDDMDKLGKRVGKLQSSMDESVAELKVLGGVVDAQMLKIQQLGEEGPFQTASTSGDGGTGSLANLSTEVAKIADLEKRVKQQEEALNLVLESLISSGVAFGNRTSLSNTTFAEKLALLSSEMSSYNQRITSLENSNSTKVEVAALTEWVNETSMNVLELYDMLAVLSNETTTHMSGNASTSNATLEPASLPQSNVSNATGSPTGQDVESTIQDILARLSALESLVDMDSDEDVANVTFNVTTAANSTRNETSSSVPIGSMVSWMRSELLALTKKFHEQSLELNKTEGDVAVLMSTVFVVDVATANSTNTTANTTYVPHPVSRLDQLEEVVLALKAGFVEPVANGTNATDSVNSTSELDALVSRLESLEEAVFTKDGNKSVSRVELLEIVVEELNAEVEAFMNVSTKGPNSTQLLNVLDRLEDSEAMIEDLANMMDDVNASLSSIALLTNITSEQAGDIEEIMDVLVNLTTAVENNTQRLDVLEDEVDSYQEATDQALMTMQGSLRTSKNLKDEIEAFMQALNATSEGLAELEENVTEQGKRNKGLTKKVEGIMSQLEALPSLEASLSNMTGEIQRLNEGLDLVEELAQGTAQSLSDLTAGLERKGSGAKR
jgi:hypothetical protein